MDRKATQRFDLNLVKVFLAIWDSRSLTEAGEALGLTQPSVSHSLKRLRAGFDDPLFVRVGNRMEPTEAATRLRAPFEEALQLLEETLGAAREFDPAASGRTFRIVLSDTGEFVLLPRLLALVAAEAPGVGVVSVRMPPSEIEGALRSGRADLAVGYQPHLEASSCHGETLLSDRLVCLLRAGHPALDAEWTQQAFAGLGFLDVGRDATGHHMAREKLAELGFEHRVVARLEHFTVLPEVVRRTNYAALFPQSVWRQMPTQDGLEVRDLPVRIPPYDIRIWVHALFQADPGIAWLRTAFARALQVKAGPAP